MIISFGNIKGGVGKTTTTAMLSYLLANTRDKKVLCLDFSPLSDLTSLLLNTYDRTNENSPTISEVLFNDIEVVDAILPLTENLHLISGDWDLTNFNKNISKTYKKAYQKSILKSALDNIKNNYDFILIDTSTAIGLILDNVLTASDGVIINSRPLSLDLMSTIKYAKLLKEKNQNKDYHFKILGTLFLHDHTRSSEIITENIFNHANDLLPFKNIVHEKSEIRGMDNLNEVDCFQDYERVWIELNSNLRTSKELNKEYTFSLNLGTYNMLEKMARNNGYDDISEFLDIWIQGFNLEKF